MPQLTIRNVDEVLVKALKRRAAEHGRSAEAEVQEILQQALLDAAPRRSFEELLAAMPDVGDDADFCRMEGAAKKAGR